MSKSKLDKSSIKFVRNLSIETKSRVIYEYLKKGTSNRNIEKLIDELEESDGWQSWSVIHFYGHNRFSKAEYPYLTQKSVKNELNEINDSELEMFYLERTDLEEASDTDNHYGDDIFRMIKTRKGQHKLRKSLLKNYRTKCALCNISNPKLLITSHIKTWAESSKEEKVNPSNGILLCVLHDALFVHGFISIADDYNILFSSKFNFENEGINKDIFFTEPTKNSPTSTFLKEHRLKHGY